MRWMMTAATRPAVQVARGPRGTATGILRGDIPGHGARRQERRSRHRAGNRRGARGDAAVYAQRGRAAARHRTFHRRQTRGFSARRDPGTAVPPGGRPAGPAPPVRADPARGGAARQRLERRPARRLHAHLPRAADLAARVRRARGHVAHAGQRRVRAARLGGRCEPRVARPRRATGGRLRSAGRAGKHTGCRGNARVPPAR